MTSQNQKRHKRVSADDATVWFAVLQHARNLGDISLSRRAEQKLLNLGVQISFSFDSIGNPDHRQCCLCGLYDAVDELRRDLNRRVVLPDDMEEGQ